MDIYKSNRDESVLGVAISTPEEADWALTALKVRSAELRRAGSVRLGDPELDRIRIAGAAVAGLINGVNARKYPIVLRGDDVPHVLETLNKAASERTEVPSGLREPTVSAMHPVVFDAKMQSLSAVVHLENATFQMPGTLDG